MFVIYIKLNGAKEIAPIPCKAIFESAILGADYMELHGVDERIKDNILPKATIKVMTIRKAHIESIVSFNAYKEEVRKDTVEPKTEEPPPKKEVVKKKEEPKTKRKYVRSGKYSKKKK
tara:strand:+ start:6761 stop:7114 length:354 start_codon:yes stop_codon:yes gene_type:complete